MSTQAIIVNNRLRKTDLPLLRVKNKSLKTTKPTTSFFPSVKAIGRAVSVGKCESGAAQKTCAINLLAGSIYL